MTTHELTKANAKLLYDQNLPELFDRILKLKTNIEQQQQIDISYDPDIQIHDNDDQNTKYSKQIKQLIHTLQSATHIHRVHDLIDLLNKNLLFQ